MRLAVCGASNLDQRSGGLLRPAGFRPDRPSQTRSPSQVSRELSKLGLRRSSSALLRLLLVSIAKLV